MVGKQRTETSIDKWCKFELRQKEILDIIKMTGGSIDFIQLEDDEKNQDE